MCGRLPMESCYSVCPCIVGSHLYTNKYQTLITNPEQERLIEQDLEILEEVNS